MRKLILSIFLITALLSAFSQSIYHTPYPDSINKSKLRTAIGVQAGTYATELYFLSQIWYKDHERVPFHFYNDSKGYLQIDKFGHAYGAYRESYSAYHSFRRAGLSKKKALIYGGPIGLIFQTPIEIFDGAYEGWGFSWPDMIANTFGSALLIGQELAFNEQIFIMKFSYSPSIYPDYHAYLGESHLERFFLDYNGHSYWFSGNLRKLTQSNKIPEWLNVAIGYSANGMIYEFENPTFYRGEPFPYFERHRQYILSLDVDFTRVPTHKKWLKTLFKTINLIKIPFPGIEYNKVEGLKVRALYF